MFSDCSGPCDHCMIGYTGGCMAGHGDDDFTKVTEDNLSHILEFASQDSIKRLFRFFPELERKVKLNKINNNLK